MVYDSVDLVILAFDFLRLKLYMLWTCSLCAELELSCIILLLTYTTHKYTAFDFDLLT